MRLALVDVQKPKVTIIVGKKADIDARAQLAPKCMIPATYSYGTESEEVESPNHDAYSPVLKGRPNMF